MISLSSLTIKLPMRLLPLTFVALLLALQYPLWLGHGSLHRAHLLEEQVAAQRARNEQQRSHNLALEAEVHDLSTGTEAIEERARADLGMVRDGETWFRYPSGGNQSAPAASQHR